MVKMSVIKFLALYLAVVSLFESAGALHERCTKSQNCMACDSNNKCDACFNWNGVMKPKALQSGSCSKDLKLITGCSWYKGTYPNGATPIDYCKSCTAGKILVYNVSTLLLKCMEPTGAGSDSQCQNIEIDNCEQTFCYIAGITISGCSKCQKHYSPVSSSVTTPGASGCQKVESIKHCEWYESLSKPFSCYGCGKNYVLNSSGTCTSYSIDSNCRMLDNSKLCHYCWHSYYWDTYFCKLSAKYLGMFIGLAIILGFLSNEF
jgi:hypothetical protein